MDIHIPRTLIIGVGVLLGTIGAIWLGTKAIGGVSDLLEDDQGLACDQAQAREAARQSGLRGETQVVNPEQINLVGCGNLDGDEADEMVVQVTPTAGGASSAPWGIFAERDGQWEVQIKRVLPAPEVRLEAGEVTETTPAYGPNDANCCPSATRTGQVVFEGGEFRYHSDLAEPAREITVQDGSNQVLDIGALQLFAPSVSSAEPAFGVPSQLQLLSKETCEAQWRDLGLKLYFINFSVDACEAGAEITVAVFEGPEARQAGWTLPGGVRIGDSMESVSQAFPEIAPTKATFADDLGVIESGDAQPYQLLPSSGDTPPPVIGHFLDGRLEAIQAVTTRGE